MLGSSAKGKQLQQNFEAVVSLLQDSEGERNRLKDELRQAQAEQAEAEEKWTAAADAFEEQLAERERSEAERHATLIAERDEAVQVAAEITAQAEALEARAVKAEVRASGAEADGARLAAEVTALQERLATAVADATAAKEQELAALEAELTALRAESAEAAATAKETAAAAAAAAAAREAELSEQLETAQQESERLGQKMATTEANATDRAAAAEKAETSMREELRRSVGVERQRVAGMLYKEALQTHTLDEQARQLEELNAELADTRESLREAQEASEEAAAVAAAQEAENAQMAVHLQALQDSQHKSVRYIETLDDELAAEQATREEQARHPERHSHCAALVTSLQARLDDSTAKEAAASSRAKDAETALTAHKRMVRELRIAAGAIKLKTHVAACQTERMPAPEMAVQTDWAAVHMPLPSLPHGGCILPKAK